MNLYKYISKEDYLKLQETRSQDGGDNRLAPWAEAFLEKYLEYIKGPILDVGCASGALVKHFREELDLDAKGLDIVEKAVNKGIEQGTPIIWHDVHKKLPFPDKSFKTITMFHTLEHTLDPKLVLKNLHRVLDGNLCIIVPLFDVSKVGIDYHSAHTVYLPTIEYLENCLKNYKILISESEGPWSGHLIIASPRHEEFVTSV